MFFQPHLPVETNTDGPFYKAFLNFLHPVGGVMPILYPLLAFSFLFIQAVILTTVINNHRMMNRPNYYPGMAYMLITSLFPGFNQFSAPLLASLCLLLIYLAVIKVYSIPQALGRIYNIGLALGLTSFIYYPTSVFVIWAILALAILRPFKLNEWVVCLLGLATPYYFLAVFLFYTDTWQLQKLLPTIYLGVKPVTRSLWLAGSVFLAALPFVTGGYSIQESLRRMLIHVRKGWTIFLLYLAFALFVPFISDSSHQSWVITAIPLAAFHACTYMYSHTKLYPKVLFWATVVFIIAYQYYYVGGWA